jgi:3-oxoacyl-[acyl-carrier protein] reductase
MAQAGGGAIVNISSVRAIVGSARNVHYTVSKAALIGLTRSLARAFGPAAITVNALVVGAIKTPAEASYGPEAEIDERLISLQRG